MRPLPTRPTSRHLHQALVALAGALAAPGASGAQQHGELHRMMPANFAYAVHLGDLDGDGDLDLYECSCCGHSDRVLLWEDDAGFVELPGAAPKTTSADKQVDLGDVDGDGDLDAYVAQSGQNQLHLNDGFALFSLAAGALPSISENSQSVELGDLDLDGDLDAVIGIYAAIDRIARNDGGVFSYVPGPFTAPDGTYDVALADVDGNGLPDVITANTSPGPNRLYRNAGGMAFAEVAGAFGGSSSTSDAAVGDVDGDLDVDVAFGHDAFGGGGAGLLYRNDGTGTFAGEELPCFLWTEAAALVDLDGDLDLDFLAMSASSIQADVLLLNDGTGAFTDASGQLGGSGYGNSWDMDVGDIDLDGDADVVLGLNYQGRLMLNDGGGEFTDVSGPFADDSYYTTALALADADGDGDLDLFQGNDLDDPNRFRVNNGSGTFAPVVSALPPLGPSKTKDALFGDWDGDGDQDLLVINDGKNRAFRNDGTGIFTYAAGDTPGDLLASYDAAAGDLDGDGDPDAVVANDLFWTQVYENDGAGDFSNDLAAFPHDFEVTHAVALGDLDADGDLDVVRGFTSNRRADAHLNDGAGKFLPAPLLTTLTTSSFNVATVDADQDGDDDVFIGRIGKDELILSALPAGFTDASSGLPTTVAGSTDVTVTDLDKDGLQDIVLAASDGPVVYLGQGAGLFSDATSLYLPKFNALAVATGDLDGDGAIDIVFGLSDRDRVWYDLRRQVAWRAVARLGKPVTLDVYGAPAEPWFLAVSFGTASIALPFGTLLLDPAGLLVLAGGVLDGTGRGAATFPVPSDPSIVGLSIYWQAALGVPLELSNLEVVTVTDL